MGRVWYRCVFLLGIVNCSGIVGGRPARDIPRILGLKDGIFRLIRVCCTHDSLFFFFENGLQFFLSRRGSATREF